MFELKGKIIASSESESQYDCSKGDNACTSNPMEPSIKRFLNATFSLAEVAFRRNTCFVRNLEGVDLLKGNRSTNLYTINLHDMASVSLICLMARASFTKSWLWHQRLSHLNFDTINDLAKNDLVSGLPKFKYHKEHLCPSCENWTLVEATKTMLIFSRAPLFLWAEAIATACFTQNRSIIHRRFNKTPYELINDRKPDISFFYVFRDLCYPKNDREDIGKLGAKGDIDIFIGYSADSYAYKIYNRRTKKIMETMNVSFDELSAMAFEQRSSKLRLQSMTSCQISSGLDLTYAPSIITTQQPTEGELDLLFEAMYDDFIGGQPSAAQRTVLAAQAQQVRQTSTTSTSIADSAPTPTNSSSLATNFPNTSQDVDELNSQQQHNVKEAMTDPAWIESMQEELLQFKRLDAKPTKKHLKEVKRIFHYLQGTVNTGLWYTKDSGFKLTGFSDADYARCKDTIKSTSGGAQFLGEKLLTDYGFGFNKIPIYCDSKLAIAISCNPIQHSRTKRIAVRYHFIKEHVEKGTTGLYFVKTDYQLADLFTKALLADHFNYLVCRLGMCSLSPQDLDRLAKSQ
nr:retrovirus-related Pol polyprotein from transposon TNT 1-94 [Tanacetum cinerariifolium]